MTLRSEEMLQSTSFSWPALVSRRNDRSWLPLAATLLCVTTLAAAQPSPLQIRNQQQLEAERRKTEDAARQRKEAEERANRLQAELDALKARQAAEANRPKPPATAVAASAAVQPSPVVVIVPASRYRRMEELLQVEGCEACGQMSAIEAGTFDMGSPDAEPGRHDHEGPVRREVSVARFEVGRTEVTQGQWKAVMGNNPSHFSNCGDGCPVEMVSWDDIMGPDGFLTRLNRRLGLSGDKGYRLLTEMEWEYAARAGSRTAFWWGNGISPAQANYDADWDVNSRYVGDEKRVARRDKTMKADAFDANAWGLYNVHGNVGEWVADCFYIYEGASQMGQERKGGCHFGRVVRGGYFGLLSKGVRSAARWYEARHNRRAHVGFRLARTL